MAYVVNWREMEPQVRHMSAVVWGGLRARGEDADKRETPDSNLHRLENIKGFARHALQGRKTSDHHNHDCTEQVYYILSGSGEVLNGDERHVTHAGDAVYLPSGEYHQMFNEEEPWLEHHVISASVESDGGTFAIRNWKDVSPTGDGDGAVRWRQLGRADKDGTGYLRSFHFIDREAVQPGGKSIERVYEEVEQVYYILENRGTMVVDGKEYQVTEGDNVHISSGQRYEVQNSHDEWLTYLVVGA